MNSSDPTLESSLEETPVSANPEPEGEDSMKEYYQLKQELLTITFLVSIVIFVCVWFFYSFNIALNYLLGACTSVVYLRMLAKNVERLGQENRRIGKSHLAIFVGLMILSTQWNQLKVLPIFLGFLTYKVTLLIYVFRDTFWGDSK